MTFFLQKLTSYFLYPYNTACALLLLGILWSIIKRAKSADGWSFKAIFKNLHLGHYCIFASFVIIFALSTKQLSHKLVHFLEKDYPIQSIDLKGKSGVAVVLGCGVKHYGYEDGSEVELANVAMLRCLQAVEQAKRNPLLKIIVTGGVVLRDFGPSEAEVMKHFIVKMGIDAERVVVEGNSLNTWESAINIKKILAGKQDMNGGDVQNPLYLITTRMHLWRSSLVFKKAGLHTVLIPADRRVDLAENPNGRPFNIFGDFGVKNMERGCYACYEIIGVLYYKLTGRA